MAKNPAIENPVQSQVETGGTSQGGARPSDDELLDKLFPSLNFKNGEARAGDLDAGVPGTFSLKNSIEDYFIEVKEKHLLLTVELEGVPHAGGLYHAYLGLFDNNGNLPTPPVDLENWHNITSENGHFGGDEGSFGLYDCKGMKYILSITGICPNGSCCRDEASLFKITDGKFENIADGVNIKASANGNPWKILFSGDKLIIKTVPEISDGDCPETDYGELKWNSETCKFE